MQKVTAEYIESIKYHEMKSKFEELGIGHVYKPNTKGIVLIKNALEALNLVKTGEKTEVSETVDTSTIEKIEGEEKYSKIPGVEEPNEAPGIDQINDNREGEKVDSGNQKEGEYSHKVEIKVEIPEEELKTLEKVEVKEELNEIIETVKTGPSKEDLEKSLKNIEANLKNNLPSHRAILLKKKEELMDRLGLL